MDKITERIKILMEAEQLTPARFADNLDIGRAVVSHMLNGRNNPSLDVITRILNNIPTINSEWLLTGAGNMYKAEGLIVEGDHHPANKDILPDLFSQPTAENPVNLSIPLSENIYDKETMVNREKNDIQNIVNERIIYKEQPSKKVRQIIIYYSDNTFEILKPES